MLLQLHEAIRLPSSREYVPQKLRAEAHLQKKYS